MNNLIKTKGIVVEINDSTSYRVELKDRTIIHATISSKLRKPLDFDIYVGEEVPIDMSPHDKARGRINTLYWKRTKPEK